METFVVLRDLQRPQRIRPLGTEFHMVDRELETGSFAETESYDSEIWEGAAEEEPVVPEPRIDVEELNEKDRKDLQGDPEVIEIAASMPTRLIVPLDVDDPDAGRGVWGVSAVGALESAFTGAGTVVAVLDTGIDRLHPAFNGVDLVERDFSGGGDGDTRGHGTHCAATIFGRDVDGERIGVARGVTRALIGKVLDDQGRGTSARLFEAIRWAADEHAHVISMSLGFDFPGMVKKLASAGWPVDLATSRALEAYRGNLRVFDALMAMLRALEPFDDGTVVVAAAGNESRRTTNPNYEIATSLPAAALGVVSVAAVGQGPDGLEVGYFSNTNVQISAPGIDIKSAKAGGTTTTMTGTSMACPHVAGVAALWWEAVRGMGIPVKASTVMAKLLASARTDVFAPAVDVADRGLGLATAP